jgi:hypothetical protein
MSDRIPVELRWKWFVDDLWQRWRRLHRLYVRRFYSWNSR